jgi:hypothetical protein
LSLGGNSQHQKTSNLRIYIGKPSKLIFK